MLAAVRLYISLESRYLKPHLLRVVALAVVLLSGIALSLTAPQFVRHFIDTAQEQGSIATLYVAAGLFLAVGITTELMSAGASYLGNDVAWRATNKMRSDLLLHVLNLDLSFHNSHTPGELIQRIDEDVNRLSNFFSQFVIRLLGGVLLGIGVLVILAIEDWRIGLAAFAFSVFYVVVHILLQRIQVRFLHVAYQAKADLDGWLGERITAIKDIRTSGAQDYEMSRFLAVQRRDILATIKGIVAWRGGGATTGALFHLGTASAMGIGLYLFMSDDITVGTIYLVIYYLTLLQQPLAMISREVEDLQRARVSIERVSRLFGTRSKVEDRGTTIIPSGAVSVEFKGVSFEYNPGVPVLRDVSFRLERGRVLGLLGRTGSGKTTLGRLVFRFYESEVGSVEIGGVGVRQTPLRELRQRIGLVTQEVQLFHASVRDNLTLFDGKIQDSRILETIETLGLQDWLYSLGSGLDTQLTPGGEQVSAGEAQLLAFARVFLRDTDIVIMDEASSRLDPATEALLGRAVGQLLVGRTAIVIAHKLTTLNRADDIMILENGSILEFGERDALMSDRSSRYSALLRTGLEEVLT